MLMEKQEVCFLSILNVNNLYDQAHNQVHLKKRNQVRQRDLKEDAEVARQSLSPCSKFITHHQGATQHSWETCNFAPFQLNAQHPSGINGKWRKGKLCSARCTSFAPWLRWQLLSSFFSSSEVMMNENLNAINASGIVFEENFTTTLLLCLSVGFVSFQSV